MEHTPTNNEHFICTGECHGVSPVSGTCQTESCSEFAEPLQSCHCDEPEHMDKVENSDSC